MTDETWKVTGTLSEKMEHDLLVMLDKKATSLTFDRRAEWQNVVTKFGKIATLCHAGTRPTL